jgi:radical SAM superfamily enzyme YgiQ (UPF0313 family)
MRVLLIQPREGKANVIKVVFRPLTLELLAAYLDQHEIDIYDMRVDETPLARKLEDFRPELIGVTCPFTVTVPVTCALADEIKAISPYVPIVVGGVHPSLLPQDFSGASVDMIVRGPGELTLARIAAAIERGDPLAGVKGLFLRDGDGFVFTGDAEEIYGLDGFRHPARHLTKKYLERYPRSPRGQTTSLTITSRGCPHRCSFCAAWKVQGGKFVMRGVEDIVSEIEGTEEDLVYFFDDNSFVNVPRMKELAARLQERKIAKEYQMWGSADILARHEDVVQAWAEVGLQRVFIGFESCRDEDLERYHKKATVETNKRAFEVLTRHGIDVSPTFIVGYDFKTADFERLHQYLVESDFLMPYSFIYTPLPGTEAWQVHEHELVTRDYEYFNLFHPTLKPQYMSTEEFVVRFTDLYLRNPSWQLIASRAPLAREILDGIAQLRASNSLLAD